MTSSVEMFKGYVDRVEIGSKFLRLAGWAVDSEGEPVLNLKVMLDDVELPIWELKRVIREDVPKVVKNASSLCGFNILIPLTSLAKSASILEIIVGSTIPVNAYTLPMGRNATVNWDDVFSANSSITAKKEIINYSHFNSVTRQVNAINFVAIYGTSNSGKTTLCQNLFSIESGIIVIHTDKIFDFKIAPALINQEKFLVRKTKALPEHFNIAKYVDSASFDYNLFIQCLNDELMQLLIEFPNTYLVLLDGYVFKEYEKIFADLHIPKEQTFSVHSLKDSENYTVGGLDVSEVGYTGILEYIKKVFRKKCQEITVPKATYQNLESLGVYDEKHNLTSDSETLLKYNASHLDEIITSKNRFADIGCNAGFFCFRVAEKTTGLVNGVDMSQHWLEIASHVNNSILHHKNITFFKAEAIEFLSDKANSYEVIHCSSTYHYFRDQQIDFLKVARCALSENGMLILEVEIADEGKKPMVIKKSRGVDTAPCAFPNRAMFLKQIKGLFKIENEFDSVFQKGSFYNRTYFHLRAF